MLIEHRGILQAISSGPFGNPLAIFIIFTIVFALSAIIIRAKSRKKEKGIQTDTPMVAQVDPAKSQSAGYCTSPQNNSSAQIPMRQPTANKPSPGKIILGAILALIGGVAAGWGYAQQQTWEYQASKAFEEYSADIILIDVAFFGGITLLIIGIIVTIIGIVKYSSGKAAANFQFYHTNQMQYNIPPTQQPQGKAVQQNTSAQNLSTVRTAPQAPAVPETKEKPHFSATPAKISICGKCGASMQPDMTFCPQCGWAKEPHAPIQTNFCSQCGAKLKDTDVFCPQCGNKIIK